jgi:hypothetical protein
VIPPTCCEKQLGAGYLLTTKHEHFLMSTFRPQSRALFDHKHVIGAIVTGLLLCRPRRASSLMHHDPFTFDVALDRQLSSAGSLFLDDYHTFKSVAFECILEQM